MTLLNHPENGSMVFFEGVEKKFEGGGGNESQAAKFWKQFKVSYQDYIENCIFELKISVFR